MLYWNTAQFNVLMPDCAPPVCFIALVKKWLQRRAGGRRTPGDAEPELLRVRELPETDSGLVIMSATPQKPGFSPTTYRTTQEPLPRCLLKPL